VPPEAFHSRTRCPSSANVSAAAASGPLAVFDFGLGNIVRDIDVELDEKLHHRLFAHLETDARASSRH
jgi:hypothetical protein